MQIKGAVGAVDTKGAKGSEGAECSEGVCSASIEPAEGLEPVEDQNVEELP